MRRGGGQVARKLGAVEARRSWYKSVGVRRRRGGEGGRSEGAGGGGGGRSEGREGMVLGR